MMVLFVAAHESGVGPQAKSGDVRSSAAIGGIGEVQHGYPCVMRHVT